MSAYQFQLIQGSTRTTLRIIAHSTFEATCTGLDMVKLGSAPVRITCKPMGRIAA